MAVTRKIAAILAADVVGFSRMTSADERIFTERTATPNKYWNNQGRRRA
jgi:hypothetical protein